MVRKIIFPMVIFVTLLAAANVRSAPLLVLAIAEIIFAGMMIALSIFQRSRLKAEPVRRFLHLQKGQPCECRIKVDNHSPFPVSRFRLEAEHGYGFDPNNREEVTLYGGTDKDEGYLKIEPEADHCGLNRVRLKSIRCYDWFLLSSFPKKLKTDMQIAILPDAKLKMHIIRRLQSSMRAGGQTLRCAGITMVGWFPSRRSEALYRRSWSCFRNTMQASLTSMEKR